MSNETTYFFSTRSEAWTFMFDMEAKGVTAGYPAPPKTPGEVWTVRTA